MRHLARAAAIALAVLPAPALASDEAFELWFNPTFATDLDDNTQLELETAQRFRDADDGRPDTYYGRLWVNQKVSDALTVSGAVERRINDGDADETRIMQQFSTRHGAFNTRVRLEQRFVDDTGRMGLRLRTRVGAGVPLGPDSPWSLEGNAELFTTIASTSRGGQDGLTGLRTTAGFTFDASDNVTLTLKYLRQQDFVRGGGDQVGHAPLIGVDFSF